MFESIRARFTRWHGGEGQNAGAGLDESAYDTERDLQQAEQSLDRVSVTLFYGMRSTGSGRMGNPTAPRRQR